MRLLAHCAALTLGLITLASTTRAQERPQSPSPETRELAARSLRAPRACMGTGAALLILGPTVLLADSLAAAAGADGHAAKLHPAAIAVGAVASGLGVVLLIFGVERAKDIRAARAVMKRFEAADVMLLPGGAYLSARAAF